MKAYLFIETGEVRRTHNGEEWISIGNGSCVRQTHSTYDEYPILTRHKIEIPEVATDIYVGVLVRDNTASQRDIFQISIPHPKKKVKKWKWYLGSLEDTTISPWSEEEIKKEFPHEKFYHRINETEVEE